MLTAVEVRLKSDPFVGDLVGFAQRHHLIAAAIGEDRAVPGHELVKAAESFDELAGWSE